MSDPLCVQTVSPNTDNNDKDDSLIEAVTLDNIAKFPTYMLILVYVLHLGELAFNSDSEIQARLGDIHGFSLVPYSIQSHTDVQQS